MMNRYGLRSTATAFGSALLAVACATIWLAAPDPSAATSPPPPANKAEIVFENGGRIVSIRADGAGRRVLTRRKAPVVAHPDSMDSGRPVEDRYPSISPDGRNLLFRRDVTTGTLEWITKLIVANRDGTHQRTVVELKNGVIYDPAWDPATGRVVFLRWGDNGGKDLARYRVVSVAADGTDRQTLLDRTYRPRDFDSYDAYLSSWVSGPRVSTDGSKLLYEEGHRKGTRLRVRDLATDADRIVVEQASEPAWSPDGSRIAFTRSGSIRIADADGRNERTVAKIDADDLSWSADGTRLAFASARNFPGVGSEVANEIYSVAVDGKPCLTWLTNGSPASRAPAWAPEADRSSAPAFCGGGGRRPLVELAPPARKSGPDPHLWAGPRFSGRLLSEVSQGFGTVEYTYGDCPYYSSSRCRRPMTIQSFPQCNRRIGDSVEIGERLRSFSRQRSALFLTTADRRLKASMLFTGRRRITIGYSQFIQARAGKPITMKDHLAAVRALRPVRSVVPDRSALPGPAIPRRNLRSLRKVAKVYRRSGSFTAAGERLNMPASEVRMNVRMLTFLKLHGPIRTFSCGKQRGAK